MTNTFEGIADLFFSMIISYLGALEFFFVARHLYHISFRHYENLENDFESLQELQKKIKIKLNDAREKELLSSFKTMKDCVLYKEGFRVDSYESETSESRARQNEMTEKKLRREKCLMELEKQRIIEMEIRKEIEEIEKKLMQKNRKEGRDENEIYQMHFEQQAQISGDNQEHNKKLQKKEIQLKSQSGPDFVRETTFVNTSTVDEYQLKQIKIEENSRKFREIDTQHYHQCSYPDESEGSTTLLRQKLNSESFSEPQISLCNSNTLENSTNIDVLAIEKKYSYNFERQHSSDRSKSPSHNVSENEIAIMSPLRKYELDSSVESEYAPIEDRKILKVENYNKQQNYSNQNTESLPEIFGEENLDSLADIVPENIKKEPQNQKLPDRSDLIVGDAVNLQDSRSHLLFQTEQLVDENEITMIHSINEVIPSDENTGLFTQGDANLFSHETSTKITPAISVDHVPDAGPWRDEHGLIFEGISSFYDFQASSNPSRSRPESRCSSPIIEPYPTPENIVFKNLVNNISEVEKDMEKIIEQTCYTNEIQEYDSYKAILHDVDNNSYISKLELKKCNPAAYCRSSCSVSTWPNVDNFQKNIISLHENPTQQNDMVSKMEIVKKKDDGINSSLNRLCIATNYSRSRSKSPIPTAENIQRSLISRRQKLIKQNDDVFEELGIPDNKHFDFGMDDKNKLKKEITDCPKCMDSDLSLSCSSSELHENVQNNENLYTFSDISSLDSICHSDKETNNEYPLKVKPMNYTPNNTQNPFDFKLDQKEESKSECVSSVSISFPQNDSIVLFQKETRQVPTSHSESNYNQNITKDCLDTYKINECLRSCGFKRSTYVDESLELGSEFEELRCQTAQFRRSQSPSPTLEEVELRTSHQSAIERKRLQSAILLELTSTHSSCHIDDSEKYDDTTIEMKNSITLESLNDIPNSELNPDILKEVSNSSLKNKIIDEMIHRENSFLGTSYINTNFVEKDKSVSDSALFDKHEILIQFQDSVEMEMEPEEYHHFRRFSLNQQQQIEEYPIDDYDNFYMIEQIKSITAPELWSDQNLYNQENVDIKQLNHDIDMEVENEDEKYSIDQSLKNDNNSVDGSKIEPQLIVEVEHYVEIDINILNNCSQTEESHNEDERYVDRTTGAWHEIPNVEVGATGIHQTTDSDSVYINEIYDDAMKNWKQSGILSDYENILQNMQHNLIDAEEYSNDHRTCNGNNALKAKKANPKNSMGNKLNEYRPNRDYGWRKNFKLDCETDFSKDFSENSINTDMTTDVSVIANSQKKNIDNNRRANDATNDLLAHANCIDGQVSNNMNENRINEKIKKMKWDKIKNDIPDYEMTYQTFVENETSTETQTDENSVANVKMTSSNRVLNFQNSVRKEPVEDTLFKKKNQEDCSKKFKKECKFNTLNHSESKSSVSENRDNIDDQFIKEDPNVEMVVSSDSGLLISDSASNTTATLASIAPISIANTAESFDILKDANFYPLF